MDVIFRAPLLMIMHSRKRNERLAAKGGNDSVTFSSTNIGDERWRLEDAFILRTAMAYRSIRTSLVPVFAGKEPRRLFHTIQSIVDFGGRNVEDMTSQFRESENQFSYADHEATAAPIEQLLKEHIYGIEQIKETAKKMAKLHLNLQVNGLIAGDGMSRSNRRRKTKILVRGSDGESREEGLQGTAAGAYSTALGVYGTALRQQGANMVAIQKKLMAGNELSRDVKRSIAKLANITLSLLEIFRSYGSETSQSSESDIGTSSDTSQTDDSKLLSKDRVRGEKVVSAKVSPWPLEWSAEDEVAYGKRHVDYDMFLASSFPRAPKVTVSPSKRPDKVFKTKVVWMHQQSPSENAAQDDTESFQTEVIPFKADFERGRRPTEESDMTRSLLSDKYNVYVRAVMDYQAEHEDQLSLKLGMKLKQKIPPDAQGMAYGWTRKSAVSKKKYGYFPVSHVILTKDSNLYEQRNMIGDGVHGVDNI